MNLHTKADEVGKLLPYRAIPSFASIRANWLKFVSSVCHLLSGNPRGSRITGRFQRMRDSSFLWDLPLGRMLQNALHEFHEFTLIPQSTIRFHSKNRRRVDQQTREV